MSRAAFARQRLPCVGLFLCAAAGVIVGRYVPLPGGIFAAMSVACLLAAGVPRVPSRLLTVGVILGFAAAQAWQFRESAAVRLAGELTFVEQSCVAEITVLAAPRVSESTDSRSPRSQFVARLERLELDGSGQRPDCRVLVNWNGEPPVYGGRYTISAAIANCPPVRNPGMFDHTAWLANAGIRSQLLVLRSSDARLLAVGGNPVVRFANASRAWIERAVTHGIEGTPEAALICAMVVGDTSDTPDSLKEAFRETGTFHLFSVSGLHVGIVAVLLWTALGIFGIGQRRSVLLIIPALFFYALLTGLSPASLRAAIMLSVIAASLLLDRPPVPLNSIGAAGLAILLGDSSQLFNSGFQLSFGAVTAIILLARPLQLGIETIFAPDPFLPTRLIPPLRHAALSLARGTAALLAVSLAAWIASLPLTVHYFHLISLSSIPANLLAVPLSSTVLSLSAVAIVAAGFSPGLAVIFNQTNFLLTKLLIFVVQAFASIPGSAIYVGPPFPADTVATLTVFDAAGGGAAALLTREHSWLIDSGSEFFASSAVVPFLRGRGVNRLDAFVLTHGDTRHVGGAERIFATLSPRRVCDSGLPDRSPSRRSALATIAAADIPLLPALAGLRLPVDANVSVVVLYPPASAQGVYADDKAVVLRLEAGGFRALLMSDAGLATEQWLLAHVRDRLACDAIIMGRHVSGLSGDPEFLRAAQPRMIISSGTDFPKAEQIRPEWARAVHTLGIDLLRQDETGAVTLTIRPFEVSVSPFLPAGGPPRTFPLSHAPRTDSRR